MSADPTAIAIERDPRTNRMRGVTAHKHIPFDVPYITEVATNLWVGGCTTGLVLPYDIEHLISLYPWEAYTVHHELKSGLSVRMYDSLGQALDQVQAIAGWVNVCRADGPTLVHCQAGLNRSNLVTATALIQDGMDPASAIALLRRKRSRAVLCNDSFVRWLLQQGGRNEDR